MGGPWCAGDRRVGHSLVVQILSPPREAKTKRSRKGRGWAPVLASTHRTHARSRILFVCSFIRKVCAIATDEWGGKGHEVPYACTPRTPAGFVHQFLRQVSSSSYQPKTSQQNNKRVKTGNQPARPSRFSRDLKRGGERARGTAVRFVYATCAQLSGSQCALRRHSRRVFEGALSW